MDNPNVSNVAMAVLWLAESEPVFRNLKADISQDLAQLSASAAICLRMDGGDNGSSALVSKGFLRL
jgi:hypothetical protein